MTDDEVYFAFKRFIVDVVGHTLSPSVVCNVKAGSVDVAAGTCTCEPINGDADILEARFIADLTGKTKFVPKDGSIVIVQMFTKSAGMIIGFSELATISLNGEDKGGLVTVDSLLQKINTLESELNSLKSIFTTWVPVPNDGGAALKTTAANFAANLLTPTQRTEIENKTIVQGTGI
mgnify:CR=1 FL=1